MAVRSGNPGQLNDIDALRFELVRAEKLRREGKLRDSEKICRHLLAKHPTYLGALQTFGLVSLEKKNFPQAVTCFLTASAEAPEDPSNFLNLAVAWIGLERYATARLMLEKALELNPLVSEVHHLLGDVETRDRDYQRARECYAEAVRLDAGNFIALFKLADTQVTLGAFDEAKAALKKLHKKRPEWTAVTSLYTQLPDQLIDVDLQGLLDKSKKQPSETAQEFETNKKFVEANILNKSGKYSEAWEVLTQANSETSASLKGEVKRSREGRERQFALAKAAIENGVRESRANGTVTPLFIFGASRSGKTTLENLLSSHADIHPGFENSNVEQSTRRAAQVSGIYTIENLWGLPPKLWPEFAKDFKQRIAKQAKGCAVITNTSPGLIGSAAQIAVSVPEAKFVFVDRDERDLALRIFMKKYKRGNFYAYDMDEIRDYIAWYRGFFDLLMEKLGDRAIRVSYEDMVADYEATYNQMLGLCNLESASSSLPESIGNDVGCAAPYSDWF